MIKDAYAAVLALACLLPQPAAAVAVGDALPAIVLKNYQASSTELTPAATVGKVSVINFWATWCAACKVELLEMESQFKPLLGDGAFQLALVSLDKEPEKAAAWLQGNLKEPGAFLGRLFLDGKFAAADLLKVDAFPMTVVVGRDGKVVRVQRGFKEGEGSTAELVALAGKLLKGG